MSLEERSSLARHYADCTGLTRSALARRLAVSKTTLHKWIKGAHAPPIITLRLLSVWAGISSPYESGLLIPRWQAGKPKTSGWFWCQYSGMTDSVPRFVFYNDNLELLVTAPEAGIGSGTIPLADERCLITWHHDMISPPPQTDSIDNRV